MISVEFTEADAAALHYERFHHPHPRVQLKMEALWLKSQGETHQRIAQLCRIHVNTVTAYVEEYAEGGIERLKEVRFQRPQSELSEHQTRIEDAFAESPPATIAEAADRIEALTGIKRSPTQVGVFLKKLGIKRRKVGVIPSKADPDEQDEYKKKELTPRLEEAEAGRRAVFFVDAAHFVFGAFLGYVWCFARVFIPSPSGRQRFNVLGAVNAVTHQLITVTNQTYITASSVCELLWKIADLNLTIPVTVVLDNARYQRCRAVESFAAFLGIELLFLPSYSPNLNLIERLWKFVKKQCLYSKYYSTFELFKSAIADCLDTAHTVHKAKLDSLLTLRFQTFPKLKTEPQLLVFPALELDEKSQPMAA